MNMTYSDESVNIFDQHVYKNHVSSQLHHIYIYTFILSHPPPQVEKTSRAKRFRVFPLEDRAGKSGSTSESQPASGRNFAGWKSWKKTKWHQLMDGKMLRMTAVFFSPFFFTWAGDKTPVTRWDKQTTNLNWWVYRISEFINRMLRYTVSVR